MTIKEFETFVLGEFSSGKTLKDVRNTIRNLLHSFTKQEAGHLYGSEVLNAWIKANDDEIRKIIIEESQVIYEKFHSRPTRHGS